jgi:hypothetical protein
MTAARPALAQHPPGMDELFTLHTDHVFLRREALEHGYDDRDLRMAVRTGVLDKVRHGAYVPSTVWKAADELQRHQLRGHAVLRSHRSALALSHTTAAIEHGLRLHRPDLSKVHVVSLDKPLARSTPDIAYHEPPVDGAHLEEHADGVLVVDPLRAALQAAALTSVPSGLVVLDSVVDLKKVPVDDVLAAFSTYSGPGSRRLQVTVRLVRSGAQSVAETLSRHLCWHQHVPEPVLQFEVRDEHGNLVGRTDFAWPDFRTLGEFDGAVKYERDLRPGETVHDAVMREKHREDRLREITGWVMIRLIWADLFRPDATGARIRHQLMRGARLR